MPKKLYLKQLSLAKVRSLNVKTVLSRAIQFSISARFRSIWPIDKTLSSATTPGQSRHGSDGNEWVLCITQNSSITGTLPSDCFVSYEGHSAGKQMVYSIAPADWANWRSKGKFISDILLWNPTYRHNIVDRPAKTFISSVGTLDAV